MNKDASIHPLADVLSRNIGVGTSIWQFCVVLPGAKIGDHCNICAHCFIENDVIVGDHCTIKNGVQLWDGIRLGNGVFVGPNVTFTNDPYPQSMRGEDWEGARVPIKFPQTHVHAQAALGGGAVILPGVTIGQGALIGQRASTYLSPSAPPEALIPYENF